MVFQITHASEQGPRPCQEDRLAVHHVSPAPSAPEGGWLLAVMDGHGGYETAELIQKHLPSCFDNRLAPIIGEDMDKVMIRTTAELHHLTKEERSGSSLSMVFVPGNGRQAYTAVLGDSPIIIKDASGRIYTGPDHNVRTNEEERKIAVSRGAVYDGSYIFVQTIRGSHGLQLSRALGDRHLDEILTRSPATAEIPLNGNSFICVATDGLSDPGHFGSARETENIIRLLEQGADARTLVDWRLANFAADNVTAVVLRFIN